MMENLFTDRVNGTMNNANNLRATIYFAVIRGVLIRNYVKLYSRAT